MQHINAEQPLNTAVVHCQFIYTFSTTQRTNTSEGQANLATSRAARVVLSGGLTRHHATGGGLARHAHGLVVGRGGCHLPLRRLPVVHQLATKLLDPAHAHDNI